MRRGALIVAAGMGFAAPAHADVRSFTYTYEYSTVPEGDTTVELWHTQTRASSAAGSPHLYQGILEIEHGLTEKWDAGFYMVLEETAGSSPMTSAALGLARAKVESRYRLADRGEWPIDTMLFLDLAKEFGESNYSVLGKLVGARDFGDLTFAANVGGGRLMGKDIDDRWLLAWAAGATYQAHPRLRLGVETWGVYDDSQLATRANTVYADMGPSLCFIASPRFWVAMTLGFAITERDTSGEILGHGAVSGRAIFGIEL